MRRCTFHTLGQQTFYFNAAIRNRVFMTLLPDIAQPVPMLFVQCDSYESLGFSGSIDAWACGLLFDVVNIDGHNLTFKNLGQDKNGAGWNTANSFVLAMYRSGNRMLCPGKRCDEPCIRLLGTILR